MRSATVLLKYARAQCVFVSPHMSFPIAEMNVIY